MTSDSFTAICGLRMKNVFPNISEQFELLILALSKYIGAYGGEFTALKHRLFSWVSCGSFFSYSSKIIKALVAHKDIAERIETAEAIHAIYGIPNFCVIVDVSL